MANINDFAKQRIALRYFLLGAGFKKAAEAMSWGEGYHRGVRKDGTTPEFAHQIGITSLVRTQLGCLRHPEETLVVALLHDLREDYDVSDAEVRERFGTLVADAVDTMTKTFRGARRDDESLFERIAANPISSIAKPADRINNQDSMVGVFTPVKMASYVDETRRLFLPMLKKAKRSFPDQEPAYENSKLILNSQLAMLDAILSSEGATD